MFISTDYQAVVFKEKHGYPPYFCIDGSGDLAKESPAAFIKLVDRAESSRGKGSASTPGNFLKQ